MGRSGERRAVTYLRGRGYKILKTNYKTPYGEADIVAQEGETFVFCEVKARLTDAYGSAAEAVERHKQRRYTDIARFFLMKAGQELPVRFDVLEVFSDRVNHIPRRLRRRIPPQKVLKRRPRAGKSGFAGRAAALPAKKSEKKHKKAPRRLKNGCAAGRFMVK